MTDSLADLIDDAGHTVIAQARDFAQQVVAPQAAEWQNARTYPREAIRQGCQAGLAEIELVKTAGGMGLGFAPKLRAFEAIAAQDFAFAFALINQHNAATRIARDMAGRG